MVIGLLVRISVFPLLVQFTLNRRSDMSRTCLFCPFTRLTLKPIVAFASLGNVPVNSSMISAGSVLLPDGQIGSLDRPSARQRLTFVKGTVWPGLRLPPLEVSASA